jgi:alpha-L-fucosidase
VCSSDLELLIRSFGTDAKLLEQPVGKVSLLGSPAEIDWKQQADGLHVRFPEGASLDFSAVLRIEKSR